MLYVRQLAWFHSAPTDAASKNTEAPTRAERIKSNGGTPLMPPLREGAYLISYWEAVGMVKGGGMNPAALTSTELMAWQEGSGVVLTPWEFETLRSMSRAYLAQAHLSQKAECPPPYGSAAAQVDRATVSKKLQNLFSSITKAKR